MEATYKNHKLDGLSTRWHENGQKEIEEFYVQNVRSGKVLEWDKHGTMIRERNYKKDILEGPFKTWHDNGRLKIEGAYNNGLYQGKWYYYNAEGTLIGEAEFENGSGTHKAWYPDGTLMRVVHYVDNQKHGIERHMDVSGRNRRIITWEMGEVISDESK